jgi:hypothetical protein
MNISAGHKSWSLNDGTEHDAGMCEIEEKQE